MPLSRDYYRYWWQVKILKTMKLRAEVISHRHFIAAKPVVMARLLDQASGLNYRYAKAPEGASACSCYECRLNNMRVVP